MTVLVALFMAVFVAELVLRLRRRMITRSDQLAPGMFLYDRSLGWKLTPNWEGRHRNWDFDVRYSINSHGFRGDFDRATKGAGLRYAVLGDSYTFGFGVNCDQTFIAVLNSRDTRGNVFLNFAVPGFSTDQECLLIEQRVFDFSPDVIVLVVCLSNDLLDNELPFPVQANRGKPYFRLMPEGLVPQNMPVPATTKPGDAPGPDLLDVVFGRCGAPDNTVCQCLRRSECLRRLPGQVCRTARPSVNFDERFEHALRLFDAIVVRVRNACGKGGARLVLALMPGKSFVEQPGSPSAEFQDYLREQIVESGIEMGVQVIDVAGRLCERHKSNRTRLFHPNEGHLTEEGHRIVANILAQNLDPLSGS